MAIDGGESGGFGAESRSGEVPDSSGSGDRSVFPSAEFGEPLSRSDVRLLGMAVRKRWKIPDDTHEVLPRIVLAAAKGIAINPLTGAKKVIPMRTRLSAVETLMRMHAQNEELGPAPIEEEVDDEQIDECLDQMTLEDLRRLAADEKNGRLRVAKVEDAEAAAKSLDS